MSKTIIKIEKNDVRTSTMGDNIMIACENGPDIVFSPEALDELINDYKLICDSKSLEKQLECYGHEAEYYLIRSNNNIINLSDIIDYIKVRVLIQDDKSYDNLTVVLTKKEINKVFVGKFIPSTNDIIYLCDKSYQINSIVEKTNFYEISIVELKKHKNSSLNLQEVFENSYLDIDWMIKNILNLTYSDINYDSNKKKREFCEKYPEATIPPSDFDDFDPNTAVIDPTQVEILHFTYLMYPDIFDNFKDLKKDYDDLISYLNKYK